MGVLYAATTYNESGYSLTIPYHAELDTGTTRAILRQATRYIPENELRPFFYTE